jgi:hypothetical protein
MNPIPDTIDQFNAFGFKDTRTLNGVDVSLEQQFSDASFIQALAGVVNPLDFQLTAGTLWYTTRDALLELEMVRQDYIELGGMVDVLMVDHARLQRLVKDTQIGDRYKQQNQPLLLLLVENLYWSTVLRWWLIVDWFKS